MIKLSDQQTISKILIIEDEPDISDYLFETLELSGYLVKQAFDGVDGLEKIREFRPNLVLLDIMMPKMNGIEVCKALRSDDEFKTLKVIFITAKGSLEEKLEGFQAGANDFIVKPFSSSELLARIESHLQIDALTRELELSEQRYRQLIEHSPDGIMLFSNDTRLIFVNSRFDSLVPESCHGAEVGASLNSMCKMSPLFIEIDRLISKVYATGLIVTRTIATNFPGHLPSVLEIRGIPSDVASDQKPQVQVVLRDVTEKHNMDKLLARTEKINSLGILTAGIAHEVNNPLAGIANAIHILKKDTIEQNKKSELLELINTNIGRITRIIDDLRVFSRQERFDSGHFDIDNVIEETLKLLSYQNDNQQITMDFKPDSEPLIVAGSKSQFQQLLINILINSFQAIDGHGTITINSGKTDRNNPSAIISIADTGCGIPENELDLVFDPFFTTKRDWRGTGLGLAVSHRIVQLLKGHIQISSKEQKGTTVTLSFPLSTPESEK